MLFESPYQHAADHAEKGIHFDFIKRATPTWLSTTALPRVRAVRAAVPYIYTRIKPVSTSADTISKEAMAQHWIARNALDEERAYCPASP